MLLAIDIGNTNVVVALFEGEKIAHEWRVYTDTKRTADEYISILSTFFRDAGIPLSKIKSSIISTVVPLLLGSFVRVVEKLTGKKPLIFNSSVYKNLPITLPETAIHEIGTDLVCNAVEAYERYKSACIIVDFGTALTFTTVNHKGYLEGVAISPGLGTAIQSLFQNTAQLPSVPLEPPPSPIGTNTIHAIQAGIVLGYKGLVESLVEQTKHEICKRHAIKPTDITVIGTGGLNSVLKPITSIFTEINKSLTLHGLKRIAKIF
ncbi:MAG: type III pantothenate kinase [Treponemataceae bacterium]